MVYPGKAMPGYVTWGHGPWSQEALLNSTERFSAKKLWNPFPMAAAFSSTESRVLTTCVLLLLLQNSNANVIVEPRGLEQDPAALCAKQTCPWILAQVSALLWQRSLPYACRGSGGTTQPQGDTCSCQVDAHQRCLPSNTPPFCAPRVGL